MDENNKYLVKEAIRGDSKAINELVETYYRDVLYFAIKKVGINDGEDVAQYALTHAVREIGKLREPAKFRQWLMSIVYCDCMDHIKKQKRSQNMFMSTDELSEQHLTSVEESSREFLPEYALEDEQQRKLIFEVFDALPENYADCLRMHYHEGLPYNEIAYVMGVNWTKVRNDLARGRKLFKKRYEEASGKVYSFYVVPMGAIPMLTRLLKLEQEQVVVPEVSERVLEAVQAQIMTVGEINTVNGSSTRSGTAAKVIAGTVSSIIVIGGIFAAFYSEQKREIPEALPKAVIQEEKPEIAEVPEPEEPVVDDYFILTVADMIGEEEAENLVRFETESVTEQEWQEFLQRIGASQERTAEETDYTYCTYLLEKQDKQLLLAEQRAKDSGKIRVISMFDKIQETPPMLEIVFLFE